MAAAAGEQLSFDSALAATLQDLKLTFYFTILPQSTIRNTSPWTNFRRPHCQWSSARPYIFLMWVWLARLGTCHTLQNIPSCFTVWARYQPRKSVVMENHLGGVGLSSTGWKMKARSQSRCANTSSFQRQSPQHLWTRLSDFRFTSTASPQLIYSLVNTCFILFEKHICCWCYFFKIITNKLINSTSSSPSQLCMVFAVWLSILASNWIHIVLYTLGF